MRMPGILWISWQRRRSSCQSGHARLTVPNGIRKLRCCLHSAARRSLTPLMSLARRASKLPAQAWVTRCFLSLATRVLVSRYFKRRKGQSKRLMLVSMMEGADFVSARVGSDESEAAAAVASEVARKVRRLSGFILRDPIAKSRLKAELHTAKNSRQAGGAHYAG